MKPSPAGLMAEAERARRHAHAPYSGFAVGAALLSEDGRVFLGSNVENASYGLTVCAERVALWKAVSEGARSFVALAVAGPARRSAPPCGACRQVLAEFAPDLRVHWRGASGRISSGSSRDCCPRPSGSRDRAPGDPERTPSGRGRVPDRPHPSRSSDHRGAHRPPL